MINIKGHSVHCTVYSVVKGCGNYKWHSRFTGGILKVKEPYMKELIALSTAQKSYKHKNSQETLELKAQDSILEQFSVFLVAIFENWKQ